MSGPSCNQETPDESSSLTGKFPRIHFPTGVWVNGVEVPHLPLDIPADQHIQDIRKMHIQEEDILICAYAKSGTHWLWEIVNMLMSGTSVYEPRGKEFFMLEFCPRSKIDEEKSPRILNSHLYMAHLPEEILNKKIKILHMVRNPKDVLVSMYHHFGNFGSFNFQDLLEVYVKNSMSFSNQFEYLRQMAAFERQHPDIPIKTVHYEDLKKNPAAVIQELAIYLGLSVTESFCQSVAAACDFQKLKSAGASKEIPGHLTEFRKTIISPEKVHKLNLYRKGVIGDWKNQFTVAQNDLFQEFIKRETADLPYEFTYISK